jgi:hypothetical protein
MAASAPRFAEPQELDDHLRVGQVVVDHEDADGSGI